MHNISSRDKEALSQETTNRNAKIVRLGTLHNSGNALLRNDELRLENNLGRARTIIRDTEGFNHMRKAKRPSLD